MPQHTVQDELDREEGGDGNERNVITNFKELRKVVPDFEKRSFNEILSGGAFTGPNASTLHPNFQRELIKVLLEIERGTGLSVGNFAQSRGSAEALADPSTLDDLLNLSRGSGSSGAAGDPFAAGKFALQKYDAKLAEHSMTVDQAIAAWQADFDKAIADSNIDITNVGNQLAADTTNATLAGNRAADIAAAEARLNSEATARADLEQRIRKSSLPEGVTLNLPGAGPVPEQIVNIQQLLSQGLPPLTDQFSGLPGKFPVANVQPGTVAPITGPAFPSLPPVPALPF